MICRGETRHVRSDFGDNNFGCSFLHSRYGAQKLNDLDERVEAVDHLLAHCGDAFVKKVNMSQDGFQHEAVMRPESALQGLFQRRDFFAQPSAGKFGQYFRVCFTSEQSMHHIFAGDAHHVGGNRSQLDVGGLKELVHAIDLSNPLINEGLAVAGKIPEVPDRFGWDETPLDESMGQQVRYPLAVFDICFAAG